MESTYSLPPNIKNPMKNSTAPTVFPTIVCRRFQNRNTGGRTTNIGKIRAVASRNQFIGQDVIKACIARQFRQDEVPDRTVVNDFYTHRLDKLLSISGAKASLDSKTITDAAFQVNWNTVRDWNESARYDHSIAEDKARDMLVAVSDPISGVLPWLKSQW